MSCYRQFLELADVSKQAFPLVVAFGVSLEVPTCIYIPDSWSFPSQQQFSGRQ